MKRGDFTNLAEDYARYRPSYNRHVVNVILGSTNKSLKNIPSEELGSVVIKEAIKRSNIKSSDVDETIMGQVLTGGTGQNPARQAAMKSGIPKEKPSTDNYYKWLKNGIL